MFPSQAALHVVDLAVVIDDQLFRIRAGGVRAAEIGTGELYGQLHRIIVVQCPCHGLPFSNASRTMVVEERARDRIHSASVPRGQCYPPARPAKRGRREDYGSSRFTAIHTLPS